VPEEFTVIRIVLPIWFYLTLLADEK
jgi:hypothetical protein